MTYDIVNKLELLQIYMHIETKAIQLSQSVLIYFWNISKVEFA